MDVKPKGIIQRVLDFAVSEFERRSRPPPRPNQDVGPELEPTPSAELAAPDAPTTSREPNPRAPAAGLHLTRAERGGLKVRWAVAPDELARSAALLDEGAVLCLRIVSFNAGRDHVTREVQDRPSIASQGECDLARADDARAVVSLGLRAGGRFVSIAHQIV
jgi:hypothetical protein